MLSVVNRFVPIHFVAVFFMLVCFRRFAGVLCRCIFYTASTNVILNSFHLAAFCQQVLSCLGLALAVFLIDMFMYQPLLSTSICPHIGWLCCNAFCSDSTCAHPLCSSFVLVGLFQERLQLLYLGLFFLEQVHDTTAFIRVFFASGPFVACCRFFFSTGVGAWGGLRPPQECAWGIEPWDCVESDPCTFLEGRMHHGQDMRCVLLFFSVTTF